MTTIERTWTKIGILHNETDAQKRYISDAIDRMTWLEIPKDGAPLSLPMMPGEGIKSAIRELRLPKPSHVAISNELAPCGLYGIRCHYKNGQVEVYLADEGSGMVVLCSDLRAEMAV